MGADPIRVAVKAVGSFLARFTTPFPCQLHKFLDPHSFVLQCREKKGNSAENLACGSANVQTERGIPLDGPAIYRICRIAQRLCLFCQIPCRSRSASF